MIILEKKQIKINNMRSKKGFTLVEVLVAMFIFTIAMVAISEIFVSFIRSYRTARVMQKDLQDAQQASNYISKTLRTSTVMSGSEDSSVIVIYDYSQGKCIQYKFAEDGLFMNIQSPAEDVEDPIKPDTCDGLFGSSDDETKLIDGEVIENGKFVRSISSGYDDDGGGDNTAKVGIVTVLISLKTGHGAPLNIQTSASLRDYEQTVNPSDIGGGDAEKNPPDVTAFDITCPSGEGMAATIVKIEADDGDEGSGIDGYAISDFNSTQQMENPSADSDVWRSDPEDFGGSYVASEAGERTLLLSVKDKNGNIGSLGSSPASCTFKTPDETPPVVTGFTIDSPIESDSLNVSGMKITATDNSGSVTACKITRDGETEPTKSAPGTGWSSCDSVSYTFPEYDTEYTLHPWARDAKGNISLESSYTADVTIIKKDKEIPEVDAFEVSSPSYSMSVKIDKIAASDDASGVASYCITEAGGTDSSGSPDNCVWKSWPKGKTEITYSEENKIVYEAKTEGIKNLYVWVKDYKDKVSALNFDKKDTVPDTVLTVTVWDYVSGPCGLVKKANQAPAAWASGSKDDTYCNTPQCNGQIPNTLVSNNDTVVFSYSSFLSSWSYNARQKCKEQGGRLPSKTEMTCIQQNQNTYGMLPAGNYWTSEEAPSVERCFLLICWDTFPNAYQVDSSNGSEVRVEKNTAGAFKCVH